VPDSQGAAELLADIVLLLKLTVGGVWGGYRWAAGAKGGHVTLGPVVLWGHLVLWGHVVLQPAVQEYIWP